MQIEKYVPYIVIGGLGIGILYYLVTRPAPVAAAPAAAAPPTVVKPGIEGILLDMAMKQTGLPESEIVIRGLRPQDLGLNNWSHTSVAANAWENMATGTVADSTFIAFTGVSYAGTNFSQLRITSGAAVREIWPIAFVAGLRDQLWHDNTPSIAQQNQPVIIDVIAKAGAATESVNIMGVVAEKRGMVVA